MQKAEIIKELKKCNPSTVNFIIALIKEKNKEVDSLRRFKAYFDSLYGQNLEVANWHQNGELEPFDNFYESAISETKGEN